MVARTQAQKAERDEHMDSAAEYAVGLMREAELRGISGYDLVIAFASVLAARNPTLAGKVLISVRDVIREQPITKILRADGQIAVAESH